MCRAAVFLILFSILSSAQAQMAAQPDTDRLFLQAAKSHNLKTELLLSIAQMESQLHPWAVNLNWEGFKPETKHDALELIKAAQDKPWLLKLEYGKDDHHRLFFRSEKDAEDALNDVINNAKLLGIAAPKQTEIRLLDTRSVDIGLMQINWKFHGRHFDSIEQLFEPEINVNYGAKYLSKLIWRHGNLEQAVAFYHSNTQHFQAKYLALFRPIYRKQLLLAKR